jgi:hypothetical protein
MDPHGHSMLYDTPGVVSNLQKQQLLEYLVLHKGANADEVQPLERLPPRIVRLTQGRSLFLGGLIQIDLISSTASDADDTTHHNTAGVLLHAFTSLPIHVTRTDKAADLFARHALASSPTPTEANPSLSQPLDTASGLLQPAWGQLGDASNIALARYASLDSAVPPSPATLRHRRVHRERVALLDIAFEGLGWVSVTPVELRGTIEYEKALRDTIIRVYTCKPVSISVREPLLPYEGSGTDKSAWIQ